MTARREWKRAAMADPTLSLEALIELVGGAPLYMAVNIRVKTHGKTIAGPMV